MPNVNAQQLLEGGRSLAASIPCVIAQLKASAKELGAEDRLDGCVSMLVSELKAWKDLTGDPDAFWDPRKEELTIYCCEA